MKTTFKTIKHYTENTIIGRFADTGKYFLRKTTDIPRGEPQMLLELSEDYISAGDTVLLPNDAIVIMTDNDMINYLDSGSTATKKIIASYPELHGVLLFKKTFVMSWVTSKNIEISKAITEFKENNMGMVYYAHPICTYGTILEKYFIEFIKINEPDVILVNPNAPEHQEGYKKEGMDYFKRMVQSCDAVYAHGFGDNTIGAGVAQEMDWMKEKGGIVEFFPLFEHSTHQKSSKAGNEFKVLSVDETRAKLKSYKD